MPDKLILPCSCFGHCTIALVTEFEAWKDEPDQWYVDFYTHSQNGTGRLRDRLREAWKLIRKRDHCYHGMVLSAAEIVALRDFLNERTEKAKTNAPR